MARKKGSRRSGRRSSRGGGGFRSMMGGWVPLSNKEIALDFAVGLTVGKANNMVAPFVDDFLEWTGEYRGEARTALLGAVAYKFGSGLIKEAGREYFRFAVMAAGAQTAPKVFNVTNVGNALVDQY